MGKLSTFLLAIFVCTFLGAQDEADSQNTATKPKRTPIQKLRVLNIHGDFSTPYSYKLSDDHTIRERGDMRAPNLYAVNLNLPIYMMKVGKQKQDMLAFTLGAEYVRDRINARANDFILGENLDSENLPTSRIFSGVQHKWRAGLSTSYITKFRNKPLILNASVFANGWDKGFVQMRTFGFGAWQFYKSERAQVGLITFAMYPYRGGTPIIPLVNFKYDITPRWSLDFLGQSQGIFINRTDERTRIGLGAAFDNRSFYTRINGSSKVMEYRLAMVKYQLNVERVVWSNLLVWGRLGLAHSFKCGIYDPLTNTSDPVLSCTHPIEPFANIGASILL